MKKQSREMNKRIRRALGRTFEEMEEMEEEEKSKPLDMNARLRAARGIEVKDEQAQ